MSLISLTNARGERLVQKRRQTSESPREFDEALDQVVFSRLLLLQICYKKLELLESKNAENLCLAHAFERNLEHFCFGQSFFLTLEVFRQVGSAQSVNSLEVIFWDFVQQV